MNKVILIGNLTNDVKYSTGGTGVLKIKNSIALNDGKDKNGKEKVNFVPIVAFGGTAELMHEYTSKGSKIAIDGSISVNNYEKDGQKKVFTEVIINRVEFLSKREKAQATAQPQAYNDEYSQEAPF